MHRYRTELSAVSQKTPGVLARTQRMAAERANPIAVAVAARDEAGAFLNSGDFAGGSAIVERAADGPSPPVLFRQVDPWSCGSDRNRIGWIFGVCLPHEDTRWCA
ncbi:hypothetical protein [Streptomyces adonidis]|uniref:Uncharacterized protein n=1 Tax=Streptomyces sp. NBC_00093 TaxID=2975649 RepID=A0AAU1ZU59_9ACTN